MKSRNSRANARKKIAVNSADVYASSKRMTLQSFLPRRTICTFKQTMFGAYTSGLAQQYGFFNLMANAFYQPFGTGATLIGTTGLNKSNITLAPGFATTQSPIGYSLMDVTYTYYKVRRARLLVRCLPTADIFLLSVEANTNQQSVVQQNSLGSNPYPKTVLAGPNQRPTEIVIDVSTPTITGYSSVQFEGLPPVLMGAAPGSTQQWFFNVQWENYTSSNPVGNAAFEFELIQEIELTEPENFTS